MVCRILPESLVLNIVTIGHAHCMQLWIHFASQVLIKCHMSECAVLFQPNNPFLRSVEVDVLF